MNPRGTSQENKEKIKDRDYRVAVNILNRGFIGAGTALSACGGETSTPYYRRSGDHGASFSREAGSPLRKRGGVHA